MAGTKRSRADSEAEEEKSNAKRHNGEAPEHEQEENEKPKEQPSQDHNKQAKNSELRDAGQKAEDGSESNKKRAREPESTDAPEAKRRAPSSQAETLYDHAHRIKLRTQVRACKTLADCGGILNKIPASNIIALAFALNDAKEDHRRELFGMLPTSLSSQIVEILANALIDRKRILQAIPFSGYDSKLESCGKHSLHKGCLAKQLDGDESPFFAMCPCF